MSGVCTGEKQAFLGYDLLQRRVTCPVVQPGCLHYLPGWGKEQFAILVILSIMACSRTPLLLEALVTRILLQRDTFTKGYLGYVCEAGGYLYLGVSWVCMGPSEKYVRLVTTFT